MHCRHFHKSYLNGRKKLRFKESYVNLDWKHLLYNYKLNVLLIPKLATQTKQILHIFQKLVTLLTSISLSVGEELKKEL